jgi:hypothetical protein
MYPAIINIDGLSENIYPYPNPSTKNKEICFQGVSIGDIIKIFNLQGELVKEDRVGKIPYIWNLTNNEEKPIASGIYIYIITNNDRIIKRGKIGVIR